MSSDDYFKQRFIDAGEVNEDVDPIEDMGTPISFMSAVGIGLADNPFVSDAVNASIERHRKAHLERIGTHIKSFNKEMAEVRKMYEEMERKKRQKTVFAGSIFGGIAIAGVLYGFLTGRVTTVIEVLAFMLGLTLLFQVFTWVDWSIYSLSDFDEVLAYIIGFIAVIAVAYIVVV